VFSKAAAPDAVCPTLSVWNFPADGRTAFWVWGGCLSVTGRLTVCGGGSGSLLRSFGDALLPHDTGVRSASGGSGGRFFRLGETALLAGEDDGSESPPRLSGAR